MKSPDNAGTLRRSVALPASLIQEVRTVAPPEIRANLNRIVTTALQEYAARRKKLAFEESMAQMAADPAVRSECADIAEEFAVAEMDGLKDDSPR